LIEGVEIRGGAGEFEAAVIAVVLDRIAEEERAALQGPPRHSRALPAWMLVGRPEEPNSPRDILRPV
jgi:hypothetical protein